MTTQTIKKMVAGKDSEGVYKPEFVKSILKSAKNKPTALFKNKKDFLEQIIYAFIR